MKSSLNSAAALLASISLLAACGGAGDEAGSLTALTVSPSTATVTWAAPATTCAAANAGTFFIYGGTAPYAIDNTSPGEVTLSTLRVEERGGSFSAAFTGGCVNPAVINIVDHQGRLITVSLINTTGG